MTRGLRRLPKHAKKWVDGSGAASLLDQQRRLYVNLDLVGEKFKWHERQFQASVISYVDKRYPKVGSLCFHVPLELLRHEGKTAAMFHALGARSGVADVVMLVPRGAYHGLVLELKVRPRRPTDAQCTFLNAARTNDYASAWTDSYNTSLLLIDSYLSLPPRARLAELSGELPTGDVL
jgi:hypothetical protein